MGYVVPPLAIYGPPTERKVVYRDAFLWYPKVVSGKLRWLTNVKRKLQVCIWDQTAGLGSYTVYEEKVLGHCTKEEAFLEEI